MAMSIHIDLILTDRSEIQMAQAKYDLGHLYRAIIKKANVARSTRPAISKSPYCLMNYIFGTHPIGSLY